MLCIGWGALQEREVAWRQVVDGFVGHAMSGQPLATLLHVPVVSRQALDDVVSSVDRQAGLGAAGPVDCIAAGVDAKPDHHAVCAMHVARERILAA